MNVKNQRRIAADIMKCSPKRIRFNKESLGDIKEAITKTDLRGLIQEGLIKKRRIKGVSRGRARARAPKRKRGQRKGHGSRKGGVSARYEKKRKWINHVRKQRKYLMSLKEAGRIEIREYRSLYLKSKGGFFRNLRHLKLYINEHKLIKNEVKTAKHKF